MKPMIWVGVILIIISPFIWIAGALSVITNSIVGMLTLYGLAFVIFLAGFLIILITITKERFKEIRKEKGKYKQYEEED